MRPGGGHDWLLPDCLDCGPHHRCRWHLLCLAVPGSAPFPSRTTGRLGGAAARCGGQLRPGCCKARLALVAIAPGTPTMRLNADLSCNPSGEKLKMQTKNNHTVQAWPGCCKTCLALVSIAPNQHHLTEGSSGAANCVLDAAKLTLPLSPVRFQISTNRVFQFCGRHLCVRCCKARLALVAIAPETPTI